MSRIIMLCMMFFIPIQLICSDYSKEITVLKISSPDEDKGCVIIKESGKEKSALICFDKCDKNTGCKTMQKFDTNDWIDVSTSGVHSCGVAKNGEKKNIYCWGINKQGMLGSSKVYESEKPVMVDTSFDDWEKVIVGLPFSCGIRNDSLFCWGRSITENKEFKTPTKMDFNLKEYDKLTADYLKICSINSGHLNCMGRKYKKNNQYFFEKKPWKILGELGKWSHVSIKSGYNCGIRDGRLYFFEDTENSIIPQKIEGSNDWTEVNVDIERAGEDVTTILNGIRKNDGKNSLYYILVDSKNNLSEPFLFKEKPDGWKMLCDRSSCGVRIEDGKEKIYRWYFKKSKSGDYVPVFYEIKITKD